MHLILLYECYLLAKGSAISMNLYMQAYSDRRRAETDGLGFGMTPPSMMYDKAEVLLL